MTADTREPEADEYPPAVLMDAPSVEVGATDEEMIAIAEAEGMPPAPPRRPFGMGILPPDEDGGDE